MIRIEYSVHHDALLLYGDDNKAFAIPSRDAAEALSAIIRFAKQSPEAAHLIAFAARELGLETYRRKLGIWRDTLERV